MPRWIVPTRREWIYARDGVTCVYCGRCLETDGCATLDHVVPRSLGGTNRTDNLVSACVSCNIIKGARSLDSAAPLLALVAREQQVKRGEEPTATAATVKLLVEMALADGVPAVRVAALAASIKRARERSDGAYRVEHGFQR